MNISCDIIRDLLPLYTEDMVSLDSRELVDEHLCGCDGCTKELAQLLKRPPVAVDAEPASLKRVSNTIRRQKVLTVLAVMMTVVSILITGMELMFNTPIYLSVEEAIEDVYLDENGNLTIDYARCVVGTGGIADDGNYFMSANTTVYGYVQAKRLDRKLSSMTREEIEAYIAELYEGVIVDPAEIDIQQRWDQFFGIRRTMPMYVDENGDKILSNEKGTGRNLIYVNRYGTDGTVLWDAGKAIDWSVVEEYDGYLWEEFFWACVILSTALFVLLRKKPGCWQREFVMRIAIALACIAFGLLAVSFGQFNFAGERLSFSWFSGSSAIALPVLLTIVLWRQLWLLNHGNKIA